MTKVRCKPLDKKIKLLSFLLCYLSFIFLCFGHLQILLSQEGQADAIIVNGDTVEYSTDNRQVSASGNVSVTYKDSTLTCDKITVNTLTKEAKAEGNVRIENEQGVVEGEDVVYNFQTGKGIISDADFRSNPYFGRAERFQRQSEEEFIAKRGYISTCSFDQPHYRIKSGKVNFFPNDKVQTKHDTFYVGQVPFFYLPRYNHSLKDPLMHVQLLPGKSKDWGPYLLSAWRYNLTDNANGRIYADYREKLGFAEGFGLNYKTEEFGQGDYKFYYTHERSRRFQQGDPAEFQRYLVRCRHKWIIDYGTNLNAEYYKIVDSKRQIYGSEYNFLKDYFYREYEKDSQPLSYLSFHRTFGYSSLDALVQKRTNRWYTQLEKLPEIKYVAPSYNILGSPFYLENIIEAANLNYKYETHSLSDDVHMNRIDSENKISMPTKLAFIRLNPFVKYRLTYYDGDIYGSLEILRSIFYAGSELSTKFYRIFNIKTGFLGLDINDLRHIITPTVIYSYNHEPTISSSKLEQIDEVDAITRSNAVTLELSNKLQTKRSNQSVDLADFRVTTNYTFNRKGGRGSNIGDILFDLELFPYSWLRINSEATYNHSGNRSDVNYNTFSSVNYDINFTFQEGRSFGLGQRYQRKGGNEIIYKLDWRLNPKWAFSVYHRIERGHDPQIIRGLKEQEYTISRDLHCWNVDLTYNIKRTEGEAVWLVFRLKAFPELEFEFNHDYHKPKAGSQSNPSLR